ncbi:lactonase family protein [Methylobacterium sp. C25]|uniref:lactonase family protein n=1 Tax=Methylobacterium sp. C25 TaxID=2721622 RepID=UPI001F442859|nr:lactonase family protein [Methylobacterium sp. C25]
MTQGTISRRTMLEGAAALAALMPGTAAFAEGATGKPRFAYVGCFTTAQRKARGDGINVFAIDAQTDAWTHAQRVPDSVNPSFLILSRDGRFLYVVHGDLDYADAFTVDPSTGKLTVLNRAATGGKNGVHLAIDPSNRFLIVANYSSGSVAVLGIRPDGGLSDQHQLLPLEGTPGPHRVEQTASHPHHVVFDPSGRFVIVPDKGLDRVFVFGWDAAAGRLTPAGSVDSRPGAGPRHLGFHPKLPVAWVLNELDSTATTYGWDAAGGKLQPRQVITTLPSTFFGASTAAEIAVSRDGRSVYCSNRGSDDVAIFSADPSTGLLAPKGWEPTQGRDPRFIAFDSEQAFFYAANEQGDTLVQLRADPSSGALNATGQTVKTPSPVTIAFSATTG